MERWTAALLGGAVQTPCQARGSLPDITKFTVTWLHFMYTATLREVLDVIRGVEFRVNYERLLIGNIAVIMVTMFVWI